MAVIQPLLEQLEAAFRPLDRLELEFIRNDRKVLEAPFTPLFVQLARHTELDQMANCRGNNVVFVFEIIPLLVESPERAGDIECNTRLFCYDQRFSHVLGLVVTEVGKLEGNLQTSKQKRVTIV